MYNLLMNYSRYTMEMSILQWKSVIKINFQSKHKVKKIAMHYPRFSLGGAERVISLLTYMFVDMGYEVVFITEEAVSDCSYSMPENVEILVIPSQSEAVSSGSYVKRAKAIENIVKSREIDTVCYHSASSNILLYDFLVYKYCLTNFIVVKHECLSGHMAFLTDLLYNQKQVFPLVDKLLVLSSAEKSFWKMMGVNAEYIYNPIGDVKVTKEKEEIADVQSKNVIVWVGRLDNHKQYQDIVPIMKRVVEEVPDAVLKIYGKEGEPGALKKLNHMITSEHMEKNIQYCGYTTQNIAELYTEASVHLVTSVSEGFPLVIYESRVNGIPLVLYQMPYLEMMRSEKGYIAVGNDDISGAARAIVQILKDDELRQRLSKEAVESIAIFGDEDLQKRWRNIFESFSVDVEQCDRLECEQDHSMKIILDAIMYHYHKGCAMLKGMGNPVLHAKLSCILPMVLKNKDLPIVIYPYGKLGMQVKQLLNETFNIQEAFVVDNNVVCDDVEIKTVEELKEMDCSKYWFLVCSSKMSYYNEIRDSLNAVVPSENVIDLFPVV